MRRIWTIVCAVVVGTFLFGCASAGSVSDLPRVSPPPEKIRQTGKQTVLTPSVHLAGRDSADADAVRILEASLSARGIAVSAQGAPGDAEIVLGLLGDEIVRVAFETEGGRQDLRLAPQGYAIAMGKGRVVIAGADPAGLFYGAQTFEQLLEQAKDRALPSVYVEDAPKIAARGIVEGFYGRPWTHEQRLDQLAFYGTQKLNLYIYAPKDDPYHREKWRDPYPAREMERMRELIETAARNKVEFVFAISPGLDIRFDGPEGEADRSALTRKIESLYAMGVRRFAVFYDDIEDKSGQKQAQLLNDIDRYLAEKGDVKPLLTVPTEYYTLDMLSGAEPKPYTKAFAETLQPGIVPLYTGPGVVCEGIDAADLRSVGEVYNRKMGIWWNYPVSDYLPSKLALGPIYGLAPDLANGTELFAVNPMEHAELSKITLYTAAAYAWNPAEYDGTIAWDSAFSALYGEMASPMKLFADHSTRMDTSWAHVGRSDAPELRGQMDALWKKARAGEDAAREMAALYESFDRMKAAQEALNAGLPSLIKTECAAQLDLFGTLAGADKVALDLVKAKIEGRDTDMAALREQTAASRTKIALLRDKTRVSDSATAFLQECLDFAER